jgi:hypothetical protein
LPKNPISTGLAKVVKIGNGSRAFRDLVVHAVAVIVNDFTVARDSRPLFFTAREVRISLGMPAKLSVFGWEIAPSMRLRSIRDFNTTTQYGGDHSIELDA